MKYLETEEIIAINQLLIERSGEKFNIWNRTGLEGAVGRHKQYDDLIDASAALMHSLMNNHPFEAANKRTAMLSGQTILESEGYRFSMDPERLADRIEQMVADHWDEKRIAVWLKRRVKT